MGNDSEFMESFLKASAQTKRTDTGVTKIKKFFVMYIFGVPHTSDLNLRISFGNCMAKTRPVGT